MNRRLVFYSGNYSKQLHFVFYYNYISIKGSFDGLEQFTNYDIQYHN